MCAKVISGSNLCHSYEAAESAPGLNPQLDGGVGYRLHSHHHRTNMAHEVLKPRRNFKSKRRLTASQMVSVRTSRQIAVCMLPQYLPIRVIWRSV